LQWAALLLVRVAVTWVEVVALDLAVHRQHVLVGLQHLKHRLKLVHHLKQVL
jgi:hypothetical protein